MHSLNTSVKDAIKSNRLINDVLEIVVEITKLIKFPSKREQLLGAVKENFEIDNDDSLEQSDSFNKTVLLYSEISGLDSHFRWEFYAY